jgi:hypothetical protein
MAKMAVNLTTFTHFCIQSFEAVANKVTISDFIESL